MQFVEDIPARNERGGRPPSYMDEAAELRSHPFSWALLTTVDTGKAASSLANQIRRGKLRAFVTNGDGAFESAARQKDVYVRYMPAERATLDGAA
ncbi:hypothetical protein OG563_26880 [Nocardia vinacea]|uniref:Uncharacterized protein n=1 Tax=Nocardia vinacea TaxID=96468 RepID=A0ABZ1YI35_9NOCA|nr:hypothetical protein [Nocardia vinacea]